MTYRTQARRVRNPGLPLGVRYTSLRIALEHYRRIGYHASWSFLTGTDPRKRTPLDERALLLALDRMEASRNAWLAEMDAYAARRKALKRALPVDSEEARYRHRRWAGPDARAATVTAVAYEWGRDWRPDRPVALWEQLAPLERELAGLVDAYLGPGLDAAQRRRLPALDARIRRTGEELRRHYRLWLPVSQLRKTAELIRCEALPLVRRGWTGDAAAIARVFWAARGRMAYLPDLYTYEQTQWWVEHVMAPRSELWIAEVNGAPVGFAALDGTRLDHLYVEPAHQGRGIGESLLATAKRRRPELDLRVFERNTGARAFYARQGFQEVGSGDGTDNEERLPDLRLRWRRERPAP